MRGLATLLIALALAGPARAEPTPIPGTRVRLEVPEGFAVSDAFPGIGRDRDLTSVLVTELATPIESTRASFSREALAERGVILHRSVEVEVDSRSGTLLHATQRAAGTTFRKWLLLMGDGSASVLITAATPLDLESQHGATLAGVLKTARWEPAAKVPPLEGLRFRVDEVAPFEIVTTAPNAVALSIRDAGAESDEVPALIVVGSSLGRVHIANLPVFSRERLQQTTSIEEIELRSEQPATLGGLPAHEMSATATDIESGRSVRVTQLLASDGERYFLLQGIFDAAQHDALAGAFRQVVGSFEVIGNP
jgi:hypothetical protein